MLSMAQGQDEDSIIELICSINSLRDEFAHHCSTKSFKKCSLVTNLSFVWYKANVMENRIDCSRETILIKVSGTNISFEIKRKHKERGTECDIETSLKTRTREKGSVKRI